MIIKLLEQPIIAVNEAEIAGTVDGVVIKGNKVSCIYHRNMENHFAIPVEKAIIGSDAVMIKDLTAMTPASQSVKPLRSMLDIYNTSGRHLGCLCEIEVDDDFVIRHLCTEDMNIEMSKVLNYEGVIIADIGDAGAKKIKTAVSEDEAAVSMEIGPDIEWNEEDNGKTVEKGSEGSELSVVRTVHQDEEKPDIPGVDPKYKYLCGKQLLEGIDIEDTFYEKGTVIDADLIRHAIGSNAIVKVIVNAED